MNSFISIFLNKSSQNKNILRTQKIVLKRKSIQIKRKINTQKKMNGIDFQDPPFYIKGIFNMKQTETITTKTKISPLLSHNKYFSCIHIFQNTVYLGTSNSRLYIYTISLNPKLHSQNEEFVLTEDKMVTPHCKTLSFVKANRDYFVTVPETDDQSFISVWQANSKQFIAALQGHKSQVSQVIFLKSQKYIASSSWDGSIKIWFLQQIQKAKACKVYKGVYPILDLKQFDEEVLIFGGDDCYLAFWNWKKEEMIRKQFCHAGSVTYIEVLPDFIFTAGGDNRFKFWSVEVDENNESSSDQDSTDQRQKYRVKKVSESQSEYNLIVYGKFYEDYLLLVDKQGETFFFTEEQKMYHLGNYFEENEDVSGIDVFGDFLLVTTTTGVLKHINIAEEISKRTFSLKNPPIPSTTKLIKLQSDITDNKNQSEQKKSQQK